MDHLSYIILFLGQSCILEALALDLSDTQEMNELKRQAFIYSFFKNISCILIRKWMSWCAKWLLNWVMKFTPVIIIRSWQKVLTIVSINISQLFEKNHGRLNPMKNSEAEILANITFIFERCFRDSMLPPCLINWIITCFVEGSIFRADVNDSGPNTFMGTLALYLPLICSPSMSCSKGQSLVLLIAPMNPLQAYDQEVAMNIDFRGNNIFWRDRQR